MSGWEWSLNWNELRSDIVLGSCPMSPPDIDRIADETGANAIMSLQTDECRSAFAIDYDAHRTYGQERGIRMVNTPMLDFNPPDQRRHLPEAVHMLTQLLAASHKVYLHCTAGINRAPLTALAYLTFVEMVEPDEAHGFIRSVRHDADPSWEAYSGAREDIIEAMRDHIHVRAYYLSQQYANDDEVRHWHQAQTDVLRQFFISPRSLPPRTRLDPNRS